MMKNDFRRPGTTDGQLREPQGSTLSGCPRGEDNYLAKQGGKSADSHASLASAGAGGAGSSEDVPRRIVVAQCSVVGASDDARLKLDALRNCQHRALNAAVAEWHRAEKRPSKRDASKEVLDRGAVTQAVKDIFENERQYWAGQIPKLEAAVIKAQYKLGQAKAKARVQKDEEAVGRLEKELQGVHRQLDKARCRATLNVPSDIYDPIIRFTDKKYKEYKKEAFRGSRSNPTFREGQPIRWRDGAWELRRTDKKGVYDLILPIHVEGNRVERATLRVIPDGPSMYGWLKRMTDEEELAAGTTGVCDARLVYSEKKKQWFAKLTARVTYSKPEPGTHVAAMRRGVHNAFVIIFDDGDCKMIEGGDVLAFKGKIKARMSSIRRHMRSLERGSGALGHGRKRRQAPIIRIHDSEARFVDNRCKTWAARVARLLKSKGVGKLLVAKSSVKEFLDTVNDEQLQGFLRQWPFAKAYGWIERACKLEGIEVEEYEVGLNLRRCPQCKHVHPHRVDVQGIFTCEVCSDFKRPADQILAWNMLIDLVGDDPLKKSEAAKRRMNEALRTTLKGVHTNAE